MAASALCFFIIPVDRSPPVSLVPFAYINGDANFFQFFDRGGTFCNYILGRWMDAMEAADKAAPSSLSVTVDSHPPPPSSPPVVPPPPPPAVLMVCFWAFTNALVSAALTSGIPCMQLVHLVQLWHGAFQALAAAAALLSDRRGVRWVLAMVALAATAANHNHYMKLRGVNGFCLGLGFLCLLLLLGGDAHGE